MRKASAAVLGAAALALPNANAWALATAPRAAAKTKVVRATRSFTGVVVSADRWGSVQVVVVVRKTTITNLTTKKKVVKRRISAVRVPVHPDHTDRSLFISQHALPILVQETIRAQSVSIDLVSGATYTSEAFARSLQSALLRARAW